MRRAGIFFLILCVMCAVLCGCAGQKETVSWEQAVDRECDSAMSEVQEMTETGIAESTRAAAARETEAAELYVDVVGAVNAPGIVRVPAGARVYEAIAQAGGFREDAASELVNQAAVLLDGQQLRIYTKEEAKELSASETPESGAGMDGVGKNSGQQKVNINTASAEELMTLPGIGESKAADIIRYREENGGFQKIEEIMNISGIKEAVFGKIKEKIVVTQ